MMDIDKYYLKPCPFCGSPGRIEEVSLEKFGLYSWAPYCSAIFAPDDRECIAGHTLLTFPRKIEAIEAWNRRVEDKQLDQIVRNMPEGDDGDCTNG